MFDSLSPLTDLVDLRVAFALVVSTIVCSFCLFSISRSRSVGWYGGPTGHPMFFLLLLVGAIAPPIILVVKFGRLALPFALIVIGILLFLRLFSYFFPGDGDTKPLPKSSLTDRSIQEPSPFIGNRETMVYHQHGSTGCEYQMKMSTSKRVFFPTVEDARQKGYKPCNWCFNDKK